MRDAWNDRIWLAQNFRFFVRDFDLIKDMFDENSLQVKRFRLLTEFNPVF